MSGEQNLKNTLKTGMSMHTLFGVEKQKSSRKNSKKNAMADIKLSCEYCRRTFKSTDLIFKHEYFCKIERRIRWKLEGDKLSMEEEPIAETSVVTHTYTCYHCEFIFYNEKHYFEHMRNFRYECRTCQTHFDNNHLLKTHYCLKFLKNLRSRMADTPKQKVKNESGSK